MAARPPKGEVIRNPTKDGFKFALRFTAYGQRRYVTLGSPAEGWGQARAGKEIENVLGVFRRAIGQPCVPPRVEPVVNPTFHEFATAWFDSTKKQIRAG